MLNLEVRRHADTFIMVETKTDTTLQRRYKTHDALTTDGTGTTRFVVVRFIRAATAAIFNMKKANLRAV